MLTTLNGLVLRERQSGDSGKFVDILTAELGVIEISAKGVKKLSSRNFGAVQLFSYSRFCLSQNGTRFSLNSAEPISSFYHVCDSLESLALASYFAEVLCCCVPSDEPAGNELMRLVLNAYHFLAKEPTRIAIPLMKSIFELRLCVELGLMPRVEACCVCGSYTSEVMRFSTADGLLYCGECCPAGVGEELSAATLAAVRHIVFADFKRLFAFRLSASPQQTLSRLSERFLLAQLDRSFRSLDFYKSVYNESDESLI